MADIAVIILKVVAEIRDVAEGVEDNHRQAHRLSERVAAIEDPMLAVRDGSKLRSQESLNQLLATVEEIQKFLERYARTTKFTRACRRKANAAEFSHLGTILTEGMQALQLDVAVDAWAKQDASDRLEDVEDMVDMLETMKTMERNRLGDHEEVMAVLQSLRNEERKELKGWVEVDYSKDLDFEGSILLGSGGFGEVCTAKWKGADVAVKRLLGTGLPRESVHALRKEIRLHSSLHFEFVAQLYAASTITPHLCLVVELASRGSLQNYLHASSEPLPHPLQAALLHDVARGMLFLHDKGILHRDLKSANVLVFANDRLKLCDFGLSKAKNDLSSRSKRGPVGSLQWMSPEEMDNGSANERTDLYSFGIVCFEVATRVEPFRGKTCAHVCGSVCTGKRPQIPAVASASPDVVVLMEQCWMQEPAERPEGFRNVVGVLNRVVSRVGDPRDGRAASSSLTLSPGASSSRSETGFRPAVRHPAATAAETRHLQPSTAFSGGHVSTPVKHVPRRAQNEPVAPDAGRASTSEADLPIATDGVSPLTALTVGATTCVGGWGGDRFEEHLSSGVTVRSIKVHAWKYGIAGIRFITSDGQEHEYGQLGSSTDKIVLGGDERVKAVSLWCSIDPPCWEPPGNFLGAIKIVTSSGQILNKGYKEMGPEQSVDVGNGRIVGWKGRSGAVIDCLGVSFEFDNLPATSTPIMVGGGGGGGFKEHLTDGTAVRSIGVHTWKYGIAGIHLVTSDGREYRYGDRGTSTDMIALGDDEHVKEMTLWFSPNPKCWDPPGNFLGAIKIVTSLEQILDQGHKTAGPERTIDVGNGIIAGWEGRGGVVMDCLGFSFQLDS